LTRLPRALKTEVTSTKELGLPHDTPLIATIAIGIGLAFLALGAQRLRLPPIVGYLLAGIVVGPFTPGYTADLDLAQQLAEIGIILLMFGVGLHFSPKDLLAVRRIALPGAIGQVMVATAMGFGLSWLLGWSAVSGLIFGLSLSVASTVVLLRALQERQIVESERGRIAVGWLIVEDLLMVLALVLLPPIIALSTGASENAATSGSLLATLGLTILKVAVFAGIMLVAGRRLIPSVLHYVAHTGSRELFRLSVLAIALGVAFAAAELFGVSFALGAFFAGMVLSESQLSSQAARETLPLRDAFAVLFFVSVGMLFNPAVLIASPLPLLAAVLVVMIGKSIAAYAIVRAFGLRHEVALTISASLAQIGEFSFILIMLGLQLNVVPELARDLVVGAAIISILLNPLLFHLIDRMIVQEEEAVRSSAPPEARVPAAAPRSIVVGIGSIGLPLAAALQQAGHDVLAVDEDSERLENARSKGIKTQEMHYGEPGALAALPLQETDTLFSTIADPFEAGHMVEWARAAHPGLRIIARAENEEAQNYLESLGASPVLTPQQQLVRGLLSAADVRPPRE
jgi:CPA2 family monovalent cation:H+ antiporter-2